METQNTDDYIVIYNGIGKIERAAGGVTFVLILGLGTSASNWLIVPAPDDG
jgi:hypothetical protein